MPAVPRDIPECGCSSRTFFLSNESQRGIAPQKAAQPAQDDVIYVLDKMLSCRKKGLD